MPRFVILEHDSPRGLHWDFMLETGEVLATWALSQPPASGKEIAAEALADHRKAYLDYEGPISGGRGSVTRWDHGTYEFQRREPNSIAVRLQGEKLIGRAMLLRSHGASANWQFSFIPEEVAWFA